VTSAPRPATVWAQCAVASLARLWSHAVVDPGFAKGDGGGPWREPKRGSGLPAGSRGRAPDGGSEGFTPWRWKLFVNLHTKWPKLKDLNEKLPTCLRQIVSCRHDHLILVTGGAAARSAHSWIHHWPHEESTSLKTLRRSSVFVFVAYPPDWFHRCLTFIVF